MNLNIQGTIPYPTRESPRGLGIGWNRLALLVITLYGILLLFPIYWMFSTSFKNSRRVLDFPPEMWPSVVTLENYQVLFHQPLFIRWFLNTVFYAGSVTIGQLFFCTLAGYAFAKARFPGSKVIFWLIISTMMVPGQVTLVPLYKLMATFHWVDTYYGLIIPGIVAPFGIFLMKQFLQTIPTEIIDAARIDGCSEFGVFWRVILHLAKPGMAVLGIFTFTGTWNGLLWPLVIANSDRMKTLQVALPALQLREQTNFALQMAGAAVASIPVFIVFFALQKYFVRGITIGAMKG